MKTSTWKDFFPPDFSGNILAIVTPQVYMMLINMWWNLGEQFLPLAAWLMYKSEIGYCFHFYEYTIIKSLN